MLNVLNALRGRLSYINLAGSKVLLLFFLAMAPLCTWGQDVPDEEGFAAEVTKMMDLTNNAEAKQVAVNFSQAWNSGRFTPSQKSTIEDLVQKMRAKNYKAYPTFSDFFQVLLKATDKQLSASQIDNLLRVASEIELNEHRNSLMHYFTFLKDFFEHNALFYSSYNSLIFSKGSFDFDYIAPYGADPDEVVEELDESQPADDWFSDWDDDSTDGWGSTDWESTDWESSSWDTTPETDVEPEPFAPLIDLPEVTGPIITFENIDLLFASRFDSSRLTGTGGSLMFLNKTFVGSGGKFSWANAGLHADSVYCTFTDYKILVNKPELSAENVSLTYIGKVDTPVEGVFDYKSVRSTPNNIRYPRFKSYDNNIRVSNLGSDNLFYKGGFSLMGNKIFSSSVVDGNAIIEVKDSGTPQFRAVSNRFNLMDTVVTADRAAIFIYHRNDSIFHPSVNFQFDIPSSVLTLLKEDGGYKDTPYYSSYFNVEMSADMIKWDLTADSLDISILNAKSQVPAIFTSQEYFKEQAFDQLVGLYNFNPLLMAVGYARRTRSSEFYADDMAAALNQNPATIRGAMAFLMQRGFIDFDSNSGYVKIKRKGFHFVMSHQKLKDFDNLLIPSISPGEPNATFKIKDQALIIRGVSRFYISELLDVYIIPNDKEITLLGNRNFVFDGQVNAGNFEYIGKEFQFDYDSFLIKLPQIDSLKFNIETVEKDGKGQNRKIKLSNQLRETAGVLYINKPNNKSAIKYYAEYPIFSSHKDAVVYFDDKRVLNGAYDKSVYFSIPSFEIDSLSSSDPSVIGFEGSFVSGGIFPEFRERLQVMPDNSLGFVHQIPYEGYSVYGKKGTSYNQLTLDGRGLRTSGKIDYLTSTLESDDFVYYIDSVTTTGTRAQIREGVVGQASFPDVKVEEYRMRWIPHKDSMYVRNIKEPFVLYKETASLEGTAIVSSNGLFGAGKLLTRGSEAISDSLFFSNNNYTARHATFEIKSSSPSKPAFTGQDVRLNFNLIEDVAEISPEVAGVAALEFPYAQFKTSITNATWNLEDKTVTMSKPDDVDISKSYFYATRKALDSLAFNATEAVYDINKLELNVSGIPYIKVADAKITPEDNKVLILENAVFDRFDNTTIVLDTLNEYHNLYKGDITILSRNKFEGDATYLYVNSVSDTFSIKMGSFELVEDPYSTRRQKRYHTVSSGEVLEADKLTLAPGLLYKGKMTMYANKPALELDGYVRLELSNMADNSWIVYKSSSDEEMGVIHIATSITDEGESVAAGLFIDSQTEELYATLLSSKRSPDDHPVFITDGYLSYDAPKNEYKVVDSRYVGIDYTGRLFTYNETNTDVRAEGKINFLPPTKDFAIDAVGIGKGNMNDAKFMFNTMLGFKFDIPTQAADLMATDIIDVVGRLGASEAEPDRTALMYKIGAMLSEQVAKDYEQRSLSAYTPLVSMSNALVRPLMFSKVNLSWSSEKNAWYSTGKLGVSNIIRHDVNAGLDGFMEIRETENGAEVNIFIQASPSTWYFFSYLNNRLMIASPSQEFNDVISSRSRAGKAKIGDYAFFKGDVVDALGFVNRFRKDYFNIEEPYQLHLPTENVVKEEEFQTVEEDEDSMDDFLFKERVEQPDDSDGF